MDDRILYGLQQREETERFDHVYLKWDLKTKECPYRWKPHPCIRYHFGNQKSKWL